MVEFRRLNMHEVPWDELDSYPDRVVFQTREWLQFLAEAKSAVPVVAEIREDGALAGYFSGLIFRKFGVRILGSSFPGWTTPYIGFNLAPGFDRARALAGLEKWAFGELRCLHYEVSDPGFQPDDGLKLGCANSPYLTYKSDLTKSEEELFQSMESACRRCIRKSEKVGVVIEETSDPAFADEYYEQLKDVFAKQGKPPTYGVDRVRLLLKHMLPTGRLLAIRARSPEGKCIATGIYPGLNDVATFWGNASWRSEQHWRPNEALHWYAMRYWKSRGVKLFDWGGGGEYKEKYGVEPYSVPWFLKSRYRLLAILRDEARRGFYQSQHLIGRLRGVQRTPYAKHDAEA